MADKNTISYTSEDSRVVGQRRANMRFDLLQQSLEQVYIPLGYTKEQINNLIGTVATKALQDTVTEMKTSFLVKHPNSFKKETQQKHIDVINNSLGAYSIMTNKTFDALLDPYTEQTDYTRHIVPDMTDTFDLEFQHVDNKTIYQTRTQIQRGIDNLNQKGRAVVWDTETHNGINKYGQSETGAITEISFRVVDRDQNDEWNVSKEIQDENVFSTIIGSTDKEYQEELALIERYHGIGQISNYEEVTAMRLALEGSLETEYAQSVDKNGKLLEGVFNYTKFSGDTNYMSREAMIRGAERRRAIGKAQEASKAVGFISSYGKSYAGVKGHEAQILKGLDKVFGSEKLTMIGYNSAAFDIPKLAIMLQKGHWSNDFREAVHDLTGGVITPENQIDLLAILRTSGIDQSKLFTPEQRKELDESGLHALQQEAIAKLAVNPDGSFKDLYLNEKGEKLLAHLATTDTKVLAEIVLNKIFNDPNNPNGAKISGIELAMTGKSFQKDVGQSIKLNGDNNQLFEVVSGEHPSSYGIWGFVKDPFTEEYRTLDGFAINSNNKITNENFNQYPLQNGSTITMSSVRRIKDGGEFHHILGMISPDMEKSGLYGVTIKTDFGNYEGSLKSGAEVFLTGTKDDLEHYLNSVLYHVADRKDENSPWIATNDKTTRSELDTVSIDPVTGEKIYGNYNRTPLTGETQEQINSEWIDMLQKRAAYRSRNESASRASREFNFRKDSGVLSYLYDMNDYIQEQKQSNPNASEEELEKQFKNKVHQNSLELEKKLRNGEKITDAEKAYTYFGYFGYEDYKDHSPNVYSETVSSSLSRLNEVKTNSYLIDQAIRASYARDGIQFNHTYTPGTNRFLPTNISGPDYYSTRNRIDTYYKGFRNGLRDAAINKYYENNDTSIDFAEHIADNYKQGEMFARDFNRFEVNLKGFRNIEDDKLVRFNIDSNAGLNVADSILRAMGKNPESKSINKIGVLKDFQEYLIDNGIYKGNDYRTISLDDSRQDAGLKIISMLKETRDNDPQSGMISSSWQYNIDDQLIEFGGLDKTEVKAKIDEISKTLPEVFIGKKDNLDSHAAKIVNQIMFKVDGYETDSYDVEKAKEVLIDNAKKAGYDDQTAKKISEIWDVQRRDSLEYVKNLLQSYNDYGIDVGYDLKNQKVFVQKGTEEAKQVNLFKNKFRDGILYNQVGGSQVVTPTGVFLSYDELHSDKFNPTRITSAIHKVMPGKRFMTSKLESAIDNATLLDQAAYGITGYMNNQLTQFSSISKKDMQDSRQQFGFYFEDVLHRFNEIGFDEFKTGDEKADEILNKLAKTKNINPESLDTKTIMALAIGRKQILNQLVEKTGLKGQIDPGDISFMFKKSGGHLIGTWNSALSYMENETDISRGIYAQHGRVVKINKDKALENLHKAYANETDINGNNVFIDSISFDDIVNTEAKITSDKTNSDLIGYETSRAVRGNQAYISTQDWKELVANYDKASKDPTSGLEELTDYSRNILEMLTTDEGAAFADARLMDSVFNENNSLQKVKFDNVKQIDYKDINNIESSDLLDAKFKMDAQYDIKYNDQTGQLEFSYGKGSYVKKDKAFLHIRGYGGEISPVSAKYNGVGKLGLFVNEQLADEASVNKLLANIKLTKNVTQDQINDAIKEAHKLLSSNYDLKYYIQREQDESHQKILTQSTEKNMMSTLTPVMGAPNSEVAQTLKEAKLDYFLDKSLNIDVLNSLEGIKQNGKDQFEKSLFAVIAVANRQKTKQEIQAQKYWRLISKTYNNDFNELRNSVSLKDATEINANFGTLDDFEKLVNKSDSDEIFDIITKNFGTIENFRVQVMNERYAPSRHMQAIFNYAGVDKPIHAVINSGKAENKHGDPLSKATRLISDLRDKYINDDNFKNSVKWSNLTKEEQESTINKKIYDILTAKYADNETDLSLWSDKGAFDGLEFKNGKIVTDKNKIQYQSLYQIKKIVEQEFGIKDANDPNKYRSLWEDDADLNGSIIANELTSGQITTGYGRHITANGNIIDVHSGTMEQMPLEAIENVYSEDSRKAAKYNHRALMMLEGNTMDYDRLQDVKSAMMNGAKGSEYGLRFFERLFGVSDVSKKLDINIGDETNSKIIKLSSASDILEEHFSDKNGTINSGLIQDIKEHMTVRPGEENPIFNSLLNDPYDNITFQNAKFGDTIINPTTNETMVKLHGHDDWITAGSQMKIIDLRNDDLFTKDKDGNIVFNQGSTAYADYKNTIRSLVEDQGMKENVIDQLVLESKKKDKTRVSKKYLSDLYSAYSYSQAIKYNRDDYIKKDITDMSTAIPEKGEDGKIYLRPNTKPNAGYEYLSIADVANKDKSVDSAVNFAKSLMNREVYLDLNIPGLDSQIYSDNEKLGRGILLPFTNSAKIDEDGIQLQETFQKQAMSLFRSAQDLSNAVNRPEGATRVGPDRVLELKKKLEENAVKLKDTISQQYTRKQGVLDNVNRAYFQDAGRFLATGSQLIGNETGALSKLEFDPFNDGTGFNLLEEEKRWHTYEQAHDPNTGDTTQSQYLDGASKYSDKTTRQLAYEAEASRLGKNVADLTSAEKSVVDDKFKVFDPFGNEIKTNPMTRAESAMRNKGLAFDYALISQEAMMRMHARQLKELGLEDVEGFSEALTEHLKTKGTMTMLDEQPHGYPKSVMAANAFISDAVHGDKIAVNTISAESTKGDFDSDNYGLNVVKARAKVTKSVTDVNGNVTQSVHYADISTATFGALQNFNKNGVSFNVEWATKEDADKIASYNRSYVSNAEYNRLWKAKQNLFINGSALDMDNYAKYTIEGTENGTLATRMENVSSADALKHDNKLKALEDAAWNRHLSSNADLQGLSTEELEQKKQSFLYDVTDTEKKKKIDSNAHYRNTLFKESIAQANEMKANNVSMSDISDFLSESREALRYDYSNKLELKEAVSTAAKKGAGEVNAALYQYLNVAKASRNVSEDQFRLMDSVQARLMSHVHSALGENYLSAKNVDKIEIDQIAKLSDAFKQAYSAMQGGSESERQAAADNLRTLIEPIITSPTNAKYLDAQADIAPNGELIADYDANGKLQVGSVRWKQENAAKLYTDMIINTDLTGMDPRLYNVGITNRGYDHNSPLLNQYDKNSDLPIMETMETFDNVSQAIGDTPQMNPIDGPARNKNVLLNNNSTNQVLDRKEALKYTPDNVVRNGGFMRDIGHLISNMRLPKGINIAGSVLGGLAVAGLANDPSAKTHSDPGPATQAQGSAMSEVNNYQDSYSASPVPSFSDSGLSSLRGGPQNGYVINISANTSGGVERAHAAVQSAIQSSVPMTSNINVAMNTSYSDKISQYQINQMVANAF